MSNTIGHLQFSDGTTRDVHRDDHGQYVLDDGGQKVYGVWLPTDDALDDAPLIVDA
jgi:hypothetical protein